MNGYCELCGKYTQLERHHVFMGNKQRSLSEKYGAIIHLCPECHRNGRYSVHKNRYVRIQTQEYMQRKIMKEQKWTIQDFIKIFGRNYT